ncbi:3-oxoacyl-[acyl-carrier-protein] reductase FabG [Geodia barretti]|uniref:3-oxoacyl-[acyl-carrier-protein] reductase n=1 Tax=Geodia barretti TaxID=519541 RepID=A0AA35VYX8_GEOBA|nr:3-oxoacyl-[acyl-carrier-protein] reductase FabG [Geodia barretti]
MSNSDINGKTALVTGASKGIGKAICLELAQMGVKVAVNYNSSKSEAEQVVQTITDMGGEAFKIHADVSDLEQVNAMVDKVSDEWGGVNILVNNAGIINDGLLMRMSDEAWHRVMGVNLNGTFYCTRATLRHMVRERWGRIINIGSVVGIRGNIGQTNYSSSKAAIIGFTKSLAKEVATRNITVNAVTPGYISTETVAGLSQRQKDTIMTWIPQGKFGNTEDIASMVGYLASERASYVTGQIISVDGGMAI